MQDHMNSQIPATPKVKSKRHCQFSSLSGYKDLSTNNRCTQKRMDKEENLSSHELGRILKYMLNFTEYLRFESIPRW